MAIVKSSRPHSGSIQSGKARIFTPEGILFLIGLSSALNFNLIGTVFGADIIIILSLPVLLLRPGPRPLLREAAPYLILCTLWLIGAITSDLIRQSPFENYSRGWARIIFFAATLTALLLLSELRIHRLMIYFIGLAVAGIVSATLFPNAYQKGVPWKFGYATPIAILVVAFASRRTTSSLAQQVSAPMIMAVINLLMNFRSMFAMLVLTIGVTTLTWGARWIAPGRRLMSTSFVLTFLTLSALGMWGGASAYGYIARSGALGAVALEKVELQDRSGLGPLLSGRAESLVSTKAIADSPILGHGSWAEDRRYMDLYAQMLRTRGVKAVGTMFDQSFIPSHSYFLGSWVEAGIAGGLFWVFCWIMTLRAMILLVDIRSAATPFAAFLLAQLLWNILFSPFGAETRFYVAGELCVVMWIIKQARLSPGLGVPPQSPIRRRIGNVD